MTTYTTDHRNTAVLKVLRAAEGPLTPTQIANKIAEPWCAPSGWGHSAAIAPVLKRIGAVKVKRGQWLKPAFEI